MPSIDCSMSPCWIAPSFSALEPTTRSCTTSAMKHSLWNEGLKMMPTPACSCLGLGVIDLRAEWAESLRLNLSLTQRARGVTARYRRNSARSSLRQSQQSNIAASLQTCVPVFTDFPGSEAVVSRFVVRSLDNLLDLFVVEVGVVQDSRVVARATTLDGLRQPGWGRGPLVLS